VVETSLVTVAPVVDYPPAGSFGYRDNMDGDSNDEGTVTESLNGETKPDPAKLAQTAIIKQVSSKPGHTVRKHLIKITHRCVPVILM
jgi:hypothetical protein